MERINSQAVYLTAHRLGEHKQRVQLFSYEQGMISGVYRPFKGRQWPMGTLVDMQWKARLTEQLGTVRLEALSEQALNPLELAPLAMQALMSMTSLLIAALPERVAETAFYHHTVALLHDLQQPDWWRYYVDWEVKLLDVLGIGLELSHCAGGGEGALIYLSPKSGRAVSAEAGAPYKDQLWPLPACLLSPEVCHPVRDYAVALRIIEQFLRRHAQVRLTPLFDMRQNLAVKLAQMA